MRMWMVNPKIMCREHLLGEHVEIHMFVGSINQGKSVKGYLEKGLLEVHNLYNRHEDIVKEMKRRQYKHNSEIDERWKFAEETGVIDKDKNYSELLSRCLKCKKRFLEFTDHEFEQVSKDM